MYNYSANTKYIGKQFLYLTSCHSTNDLAKMLNAKQLSKNGMVILAESQTQGRGQRGSTWLSSPGQNLTFSIVLHPSFINPNTSFLFNKVLSIHLLAFFRNFSPEQSALFKIKWPNDLYLNDKKIAGLLIENTLRGSELTSMVVGIGLNVNQRLFEFPSASSLALELGQELNRETLFNKLLSYLDQHLPIRYDFNEAEISTIDKAYENILWGHHEKRRYQASGEPFEGTITGVDDQGRLIVDVEGKKETFEIKSIRFLN